ncbi:universal stress protein [Algicella marina]|uniref:Universal stress protein n=1 Tax=Algicella marina TaxID=2683284 RepID=A0A6P1T130_9RHOB|nr:universal stress protein [Algicella marina]QHQ35465.1 universal stress protein [Algicella marina]
MYKHILVPIAPGNGRDSDTALKVAERLLAEGGSITALHVIEELPPYVQDHFPPGQLAATSLRMEEKLEEAVAGREDTQVAVVTGHAALTILDFAKNKGCDCIVIASHAPAMQDFLLGSTAARVVRHAECSVHVVR